MTRKQVWALMKKVNPPSPHRPSLPAAAPIPRPATPPERPHPEHFSFYESWLPQLPFRCKHSCTVLSLEAAVSFPAVFLQQLRQRNQGSGEGLSCCFVLRPCLVLAVPSLGHQTARLQPHLVPALCLAVGVDPTQASSPMDSPLKPSHVLQIAG